MYTVKEKYYIDMSTRGLETDAFFVWFERELKYIV